MNGIVLGVDVNIYCIVCGCVDRSYRIIVLDWLDAGSSVEDSVLGCRGRGIGKVKTKNKETEDEPKNHGRG